MKKKYFIIAISAITIVLTSLWFESHSEIDQIILKRETTKVIQPLIEPIKESTIVNKIKTQRNKIQPIEEPIPISADVIIPVENILYPEEYDWSDFQGNTVVAKYGKPILVDTSVFKNIKNGDIFSITLGDEIYQGKVNDYQDTHHNFINEDEYGNTTPIESTTTNFSVELKIGIPYSGDVYISYNENGEIDEMEMVLAGETNYEVFLKHGKQALYIDAQLHSEKVAKMGWIID